MSASNVPETPDAAADWRSRLVTDSAGILVVQDHCLKIEIARMGR